jgi:hypothetical protein
MTMKSQCNSEARQGEGLYPTHRDEIAMDGAPGKGKSNSYAYGEG